MHVDTALFAVDPCLGVRIGVTTRPENCALRAVRQGPSCPIPVPRSSLAVRHPGCSEARRRSPYSSPPTVQGSRRSTSPNAERRPPSWVIALRYVRVTASNEILTLVPELSRTDPRGSRGAGGPARPYLTSTEAPHGLEGLGSLLGGLLGDLLDDGLRGAVHEVLGLLQTQGGQLTHDLDDLDLLVAGTREDDVELVLLGLGLGRGASGGRAG